MGGNEVMGSTETGLFSTSPKLLCKRVVVEKEKGREAERDAMVKR